LWSNKHDEVWHVRHKEAEIALWSILPLFGQIDAIFTNYREARPVAYVKTSCAYDCINLSLLAIFANNAIFSDSFDSCEMNINVLLESQF
jgi:hypothetical protein